jgi:thioredoxin-like negative regulator of GroEL
MEMRIQSVPTVFAFHQGKVISSFVGVPDEAKYVVFSSNTDTLNISHTYTQ